MREASRHSPISPSGALVSMQTTTTVTSSTRGIHVLRGSGSVLPRVTKMKGTIRARRASYFSARTWTTCQLNHRRRRRLHRSHPPRRLLRPRTPFCLLHPFHLHRPLHLLPPVRRLLGHFAHLLPRRRLHGHRPHRPCHWLRPCLHPRYLHRPCHRLRPRHHSSAIAAGLRSTVAATTTAPFASTIAAY